MTDFLIGAAIVVAMLIGAAQAWAEMFGAPNSKVDCPHCGAQGQVRVTDVKRKQGISGGKTTAALMTGGASMVATGLSRKEPAKKLACRSCRMEWHVS